MATLHRLLAALTAHEFKGWDERNAHDRDSARPGSSAGRAAEQRMMQLELCHWRGIAATIFLWDFEKFFDTINAELLVEKVGGWRTS